jgi:hypothetical protein
MSQPSLLEPAMKPAAKRKAAKPSLKTQAQEDFGYLCRIHRLPPPQRQWSLLKSVQEPRKDGKPIPRRWDFDWCWPEYKIIVEIDGGIWRPGGGAHSHPIDLTRNMLKRNDAALAGFSVLAFTPEDVNSKRRTAIDFTMRVLASRGWQP